MKKINALIVLIFITISVSSQLQVENSQKVYLNKSLWNQLLNDFEWNLTVPVVSPWIIGVGTFKGIKTNEFANNYLREYDLFSGKDLVFRELSNTITTSFVNYIPTDSTMRIRAIYGDRVLYNYDISQSDSTVKVDFSVPNKDCGEAIVFDKKGRMLNFDSFNAFKSTRKKNVFQIDSLLISTTSFSESVVEVIEKNRIENGFITKVSTFKKDKNSSKESFVSDVIYKYNQEGKLQTLQNRDKKGKETYSIVHIYDNQGRINRILQQENNTAIKQILYEYPTTGTLIKKFNPNDYAYTITYKFANNKLTEMQIVESNYSESSEFDFEYNTQGLLMTVSEYSRINDNNSAPKKQFILSYNENNNIKKMSVINSQGVIYKEIVFEYDFLLKIQ